MFKKILQTQKIIYILIIGLFTYEYITYSSSRSKTRKDKSNKQVNITNDYNISNNEEIQNKPTTKHSKISTLSKVDNDLSTTFSEKNKHSPAEKIMLSYLSNNSNKKFKKQLRLLRRELNKQGYSKTKNEVKTMYIKLKNQGAIK